MELGTFSVSLSVKDITQSKAFYYPISKSHCYITRRQVKTESALETTALN